MRLSMGRQLPKGIILGGGANNHLSGLMDAIMDYTEFLEKKKIVDYPSGHSMKMEAPYLFDFQQSIVRWGLRRGRGAIFADCGLGKTPMQLAWANEVATHTNGHVLIFAPLAVSQQTKQEGQKFGVNVTICQSQGDVGQGVHITNYEKIDRFMLSSFSGIVLDESSILKSYTGSYRTQLIEESKSIPYRLACTATPAPNDFTELGNHAEFLGVMTRQEMLSMFFVNDSGDTGTWRLKGHAQQEFWKWVCSWAIMIRRPSDLGFHDQDFQLPGLSLQEHVLSCDTRLDGQLFAKAAETLSERRDARRQSLLARCEAAAKLANASDGPWIIWCDLNDESAMLTSMIRGAIEVKGSDAPAHKEWAMMAFARGEIRVLVTKPRIAGFGMNWQHCANMAFVGLSDSYEAFYQAVRRCWRFGQTQQVHAHLIYSELEGNVVENVKRKEEESRQMAEGMVAHMKALSMEQIRDDGHAPESYMTDHASGEGWDLYLGDAVEGIKSIKDNTIHYSIFSPPFASLFTYSNSERDMGNCRNVEEFQDHFRFLVSDLYRVLLPGRLLSFHCMNLPATITHDGFIGMKDFRGILIRLFQDAGFIYHSEVCIWKDPLIQATRTKTLTLAHKQISKDSSLCAQGYPDYIVTMRKPGKNPEPISHGRGFERYAGEMAEPQMRKTDNSQTNKYSHHVWQRYASPVWFDIRQTYTLNSIKAEEDEKHICPLQLDTIDRCLDLWSNPGDLVLSPFTGIGSEGYQAVKQGRKFIGFELKPEYFHVAEKNIRMASLDSEQMTLFR